MRTQLGGQSLQNGDIAGPSAATRKRARGARKVVVGRFPAAHRADRPARRLRDRPAARRDARRGCRPRARRPRGRRRSTGCTSRRRSAGRRQALFASMGAIQARTRHTDDPDELNPYKGAERRRRRRPHADTSDIDGAKPRVYQTADGRFLNGEGKPAPRVAVGCEAFFKPLEELDGSRATLRPPPPPTLGIRSPASRARRICTATTRRPRGRRRRRRWSCAGSAAGAAEGAARRRAPRGARGGRRRARRRRATRAATGG